MDMVGLILRLISEMRSMGKPTSLACSPQREEDADDDHGDEAHRAEGLAAVRPYRVSARRRYCDDKLAVDGTNSSSWPSDIVKYTAAGTRLYLEEGWNCVGH